MRRVARSLFVLSAVLSMILCVAVCVLWMRSQAGTGSIELIGDRTVVGRSVQVGWGNNALSVVMCRTTTPMVAADVAETIIADKALGYGDLRWWSDRPRMTAYFNAGGVRDSFVARAHVYPFAHLVLASLIPPAIACAAWAVMRFIASRRLHPGYCAGCGYDLRASPARCPECGMAAPSMS